MLFKVVKKLRFILLFGLIVSLYYSCNKQDTFDMDYKYAYFPTDSGRYVIYDVDSVTYRYTDPLYFRDSAKYQLKFEIGDTTLDNEGRINRKVFIHRRANANSAWQIYRVWYLYPGTANLQQVEDDIRFVKMIFPPTTGASWDGNAYAPKTGPYDVLEDWDYHYTEVDAPYTINGFQFDSTITISGIDDENLIQKILFKEVYAKNVGLVYKEWDYLQKQKINVTWDSLAESGFRIRYRLVDHN